MTILSPFVCAILKRQLNDDQGDDDQVAIHLNSCIHERTTEMSTVENERVYYQKKRQS